MHTCPSSASPVKPTPCWLLLPKRGQARSVTGLDVMSSVVTLATPWTSTVKVQISHLLINTYDALFPQPPTPGALIFHFPVMWSRPLLIGHLFWSERTGLLRQGNVPSYLPSLSSVSPQATPQPARQGAPTQGFFNCAGLLSYLFVFMCVKNVCVWGHLPCFMGGVCSLLPANTSPHRAVTAPCPPPHALMLDFYRTLLGKCVDTHPSQATGQ